jgi:hypothetical protein
MAHDNANVPVQHTEAQPSSELQFSQADGRLYQLWWIFEWGNKEGLGIPMNERREWRPVPIGDLNAPSTDDGGRGE